MKRKPFTRIVAWTFCAIFALATGARAQSSEPKDVTVQVQHSSKEIPVTQQEEPPVQFILETGYQSEYIFRGTNLMPDSEGGYFYRAQATVAKAGPGSFTLGVWGIHQLGDSSADSWSIGEGGGGGTGATPFTEGRALGVFTAERFPTTTQTSFREIDIYASYKFTLGPVDITFGNIVFLIHREAQTFERDVTTSPFGFFNAPPGCTGLCNQQITVGPIPTVQDETFDRIFLGLSTSKIPFITPSITYYQTLYNEGIQERGRIVFLPPTDPNAGPNVIAFDEFRNEKLRPAPGNERNDELGGYLQGKVIGNFPLGPRVNINPYAVISYSFRDRTEPVVNASNPYAGEPLTGFNHTEAGLEVDFNITPNIAIVPGAYYSYHISDPPIGTDRNEFWAGVKVAINLP